MDTTQHTVPAAGGAVPQGTGATPGGDAGATDLRTQLDQLLGERLAQHKKEVAEETWRGVQQVMDRRFSRIEPMAQQFPTVLDRLNQIANRFQQADELDLSPEERTQRQTQREIEEARQQQGQAANIAMQHYYYGQVMQQCATWHINPADPRLQSDQELLRSNPAAWHATMIQQLADVRAQDIEAANQARIDVEARRQSQVQQRQQVEAQNAQVLGGPRIDSTTPSGAPMGWFEKYQQLQATNPSEARKFMENLAKQAKNGQVRTVDQFRI